MKRRFIAIIGAAALCFSMATSALAVPLATPSAAPYGGGYGCGGGYSLMWDEDGNFLDQTAFEEYLDGLIESGVILAEDRDYFLERYEWCLTNSGGGACARGGGRGMGCRMSQPQ